MSYEFTRPLGYIRTEQPDMRRVMATSSAPVPDSWSNFGHFPDAFQAMTEDQRATSSCVGNAAVGLYEFLTQQATGKWFNFSRMMAYSWARMARGWLQRDAGSFISDCFHQVARRGVCLEVFWPFQEKLLHTVPDDRATTQALRHRIVDPTYVPHSQIKQVLSGGGDPAKARPVVIGFNVFNDLVFGSEAVRTGIIKPPNDPRRSPAGGHAILLEGYEGDWYTGPNSWGSNWGRENEIRPGWFRIHKSYIEDPRLSNDFWTAKALVGGELRRG